MEHPVLPVPALRRPASCGRAGLRHGLAGLAAVAVLAGGSPVALAQEDTPAAMTTAALPTRQIVEMTRAAVPQAAQTRIEVVPGQLDARLKLAPCQQIEPYLPAGATPWGPSRIGLRCVRGSVAWNVYLPVAVRVWRPAVVVTSALAAGAELGPSDLALAEVDIAASPSPVFTDPARLHGRRLAMAMTPGTALRQQHLAQRQWFAAGETVTIAVRGDGFTASTEGQALNPGLEGQPVRVRVSSGRIITGLPAGARLVEVRS